MEVFRHCSRSRHRRRRRKRLRFLPARKGRADGRAQRWKRREGRIRLPGVRRECQYPGPAEEPRPHPSGKSPERPRKGKARPKGERHHHARPPRNGHPRAAHPETGGRAEKRRRVDAGSEGWARGPGQRRLQDGPQHRTEAGRAGRTGSPAVALGRAAARRRRRVFGEAQRREVHPAGGGIGGPAQDRQLSLYDDRSEPRGLRHQRRGSGIGVVRHSGIDRGCCGRCRTWTRIFETRPTV
mmetsp:Transcript_15697/g.32553  ORF Transcript_15697/g.32553 Transcript_15697/m.32553 type:complete len:240 (+) Transcript_15697:374-1093(+)